jgi:molybdopterin synthase catalytic subunit
VSRHAYGISDGPLPASLLTSAALASPAHGAIASFIGVVRNHHHGRGVTHLIYDCYRPMAERMLADLIAETTTRIDADLRAHVYHGIGRMAPGEASVVIHVATAHRVAAFDACRHLIERIKQDLPVWKQEFYDDGTSQWLKGS